MASASSFIHASSLALRTAAPRSTAVAMASATWAVFSVMTGATLVSSSTQTASISWGVVGFEITWHLR